MVMVADVTEVRLLFIFVRRGVALVAAPLGQHAGRHKFAMASKCDPEPVSVLWLSGKEPAWMSSFKGELKGDLDEVKGDLGRIEASISERLSATRQASSIKRSDLEQALNAMKLRVILAEDSPSLDSLLERDVDESDPRFW